MKKLLLFVAGTSVILIVVLVAANRIAWAGRIDTATLQTDLVPSPVTYSVLLPENYEESDRRYPLLLFLHGGGGDNGFLRRTAPVFDELWKEKRIREMIVVTPDAGRSFYLDFRDGREKWETFILEELLPHVRENYRVQADRANTFVSGVSMGGMGALRLALKHPNVFSIVVAWEPGIEPAHAWKDVGLEDKFWRDDALLEERYGSPIDEEYWAANNPATIVRDDPGRVKDSGVAIYLEVGTHDSFGLDRGTEFLHRTLYDHGIPHEYRLVYQADHLGPTMVPRFMDGLMFIERALNPPEETLEIRNLHRMIRLWKRQAGLEE